MRQVYRKVGVVEHRGRNGPNGQLLRIVQTGPNTGRMTVDLTEDTPEASMASFGRLVPGDAVDVLIELTGPVSENAEVPGPEPD